MVAKTKEKMKVLGVSHPKEKKLGVNLRFSAEEGELVQRAARESGRSVAGFVRFAALRYLDELKEV